MRVRVNGSGICLRDGPNASSWTRGILASRHKDRRVLPSAANVEKDANRAGSHSIALDPHNVYGMRAVLFSYLNGTGDIEEATRVLDCFHLDSALLTPTSVGLCQTSSVTGLM